MWLVDQYCIIISVKTYVEQPNPNLNRYKYLTDFRLCQKLLSGTV